MTPEATTTFVARSRTKDAALLIPSVFAILFSLVGQSVFDTSLPEIGPRREGWPDQVLGILFFVVAALSLAASVWLLQRKLDPSVDVTADAEGIVSQQSFWGHGRLAWSEISRLEWHQSMLYTHGTPAAGKARRLMIDTAHIDVPAADLLAVIPRHRPDLVPKS
jgi:hypothetical protein